MNSMPAVFSGINSSLQQTGLKGFIRRGKIDPADVHQAREALKTAKEIVSRGDYDLVILDEINVALYFELISVPRWSRCSKPEPRTSR